MATQVLIAHTGQRLHVDTSQFTTLDDFKASISRQASIPVNYIIALVPPGKALKPLTYQTEKEIFVYDGRMTQVSSPGGPSPPVKLEVPLPKPFVASKPPNDIHNTRSLQSWQELFRERRAWALQMVDECKAMATAANESYDQMDVILSCLDAAVANLDAVVRAIESKYEELKKWVAVEQAEHSVLVTNWEQYLSLARSVPVSAAMVRLMTGRDVTGAKGRPPKQATLEDLVDLDVARREGRRAPTVLRRFNTRVGDLEKSASRLLNDFNEILQELERAAARSALNHSAEPTQLLQDIEAVAKKIEADYMTTLDFSSSTRDLLQASKIAATHTERLLPSIRNRAVEMDEMVRYAVKARNRLAAESVEFMRSITEMNSLSTNVRMQINVLGQDEELSTFDYLRLIQQVPFMYAAFTAEAIRRREWYEKVRTDSATLANEMALFQDEELKRRRKWFKSIGETNYGPESLAAEGKVPGLEINLLGDEDLWPNVTKKDLDDLYDMLQRQRAEPAIVGDIGKMIAEMGNPTKQQFKRLKAFKNGSVHEAALGRSGLLIRGDDEVFRALQDDKIKVETKLKTAESRVRRLEDLLHRQGQASRPSLGNLFQQPSQQLSDRNDSTISVKSPRLSEDRRHSSDAYDTQLLNRVKQLESELRDEKERSAMLERDVTARTTQHNDMQVQMDDINTTKKDLLENMEALKREFLEERKSLEDEIKRLQARLEDTEDEIEHFGESRENEKASYDEKVRALELALEQLSKDKNDEALKVLGQIDFLRTQVRMQGEHNESLERQLQASQDDVVSLTRRLKQSEEEGGAQLRALKELHGQLFPPLTPVPEDLGDLSEALSVKSTDVLSRLRNAEGDMMLLQSDLDQAQGAARELKAELASARQSVSDGEMTAMHLREQSLGEKARVAALEGELAAGRRQLDELRQQIADGETGSEGLRRRLEEEDAKVTTLTEELASRQSQVGSLEEELRLFQEKLQDSQGRLAALTSRFEARTDRTKDISQRLYSQNERLCRLLERLGFAVGREGGSMTITKIPRAERSSMMLSQTEPGDAGARSGTPGRAAAAGSSGSPGDLELLYWMNAGDADQEAERFEAFVASLGGFDVDVFAETVYRRVKDVEHIARKLQRDVRGYREKAHILQKEAHDKIAFRHFKEGDLALFLPTRNQTNGAWAAFNVGFPHYFLREQEAHRLRSREWLVARITRVQEKVVDLAKNLQGQAEAGDGPKTGGGETESLNDDDNPFDLSDGLRWYMIDANEDKPGAPSTPGLGKTTVAANNVEAMGDMHTHARPGSGGARTLAVLGGRPTGIDGVSKTLSKSLESRRSSTSSSRRVLPFALGAASGQGSGAAGAASSAAAAPAAGCGGSRNNNNNNNAASEANGLRAAAPDTPSAMSPTVNQAPDQPQTRAPDAVGTAGPNSLMPPPPPPGLYGSNGAGQRSDSQPSGGEASSAAGAATTRAEVHPLRPQPSRHQSHPPLQRQLQREHSAVSVESTSKRSVVWDNLWSLDLVYESGKRDAK